MDHRTFLSSLAVLGLVAAATQGCNRKAQAQIETKPLHVDTVVAEVVDAPISLRLTGSLKGERETDLAANAAGRVSKTTVERGDEVQQGTLLAQLDTSGANLSLAEAQVQVASSKTQDNINRAECARYDLLKQKGAISDLEYDQATAKCKTAPLSLKAAQVRRSIAAKNVGDGTIRAPFAGVVSERYVDVGEYVQASSKVVSIAQIGELRLEFAVPEANVPMMKVGADVEFQVAAYPEKPFHGTVRFVSGAVRASTRDLVAEALVKNTDRLLKPGMFADVALAAGIEKLPGLPQSAIFERQGKKRVYVVADGRLQERVVQIGPAVGERLAVRDGVKAGEKVATGKLEGLQNGARVE
jgi:membrane fusion protein (multidrug efflux system)